MATGGPGRTFTNILSEPAIDLATGQLAPWLGQFLLRLTGYVGPVPAAGTSKTTNLTLTQQIAATQTTANAANTPLPFPSTKIAPGPALPLVTGRTILQNGAVISDGYLGSSTTVPNGIVPGNIGDIFIQKDGALSPGCVWFKGSGAPQSLTGWVAVGTGGSSPYNRPAVGATTWYNQNGATVTDYASGPLVMKSTTNSGGSDSLTGLYVPSPGTGASWTATTNAIISGNNNSGAPGIFHFPIGITDGTKAQLMGLYYTGGPNFIVTQFSNATTGVGNNFLSGFPLIDTVTNCWWRMVYNQGANTIAWQWSPDGFDYTTLYTGTPYCTPTNIIWGLDTKGNAATYWPALLSLAYLTAA